MVALTPRAIWPSSVPQRTTPRDSWTSIRCISGRELRGRRKDSRLEPLQWLRLAGLMLGPCFAERPQDAPLLPLTVPIPNGTVQLASEQVQFIFVSRGSRPSGKNSLIKAYKPLCADERTRMRLQRLTETVHLRLKGLASMGRLAVLGCLWRARGMEGRIRRRVVERGGQPVDPSAGRPGGRSALAGAVAPAATRVQPPLISTLPPRHPQAAG